MVTCRSLDHQMGTMLGIIMRYVPDSMTISAGINQYIRQQGIAILYFGDKCIVTRFQENIIFILNIDIKMRKARSQTYRQNFDRVFFYVGIHHFTLVSCLIKGKKSEKINRWRQNYESINLIIQPKHAVRARWQTEKVNKTWITLSDQNVLDYSWN